MEQFSCLCSETLPLPREKIFRTRTQRNAIKIQSKTFILASRNFASKSHVSQFTYYIRRTTRTFDATQIKCPDFLRSFKFVSRKCGHYFHFSTQMCCFMSVILWVLELQNDDFCMNFSFRDNYFQMNSLKCTDGDSVLLFVGIACVSCLVF